MHGLHGNEAGPSVSFLRKLCSSSCVNSSGRLASRFGDAPKNWWKHHGANGLNIYCRFI